MAVPPSSGMAVLPTTSMAACRGLTPLPMLMSMPSTTTMALSTSMPRAMIRAPREMRSRTTPCIFRKMKLPQIVKSRMNPISSPLRSPMNNRSTTITMTMASARLITKPLMAVVTASDCMEITPNSMPTGICSINSRMRTLSASPMVTTLPPATVEMPRPTASLPSKCRIGIGGSW